ncbi:PREDICTED: pancreatic progenitor cell differentiation and proliferation factor-like protein [Pygoscelis adeliae]|uniref:pancreatic progenitor cell differentiation and proliferation factor-like protein n=1 Tax=Pygoscelis adeliae TaxID=9238 RepID=UPI0004F4E564|nr:PREDICTED: pancreatic progenitor cell differentiation and proliferation factor-like protein [Pygoscelis adeliae]
MAVKNTPRAGKLFTGMHLVVMALPPQRLTATPALPEREMGSVWCTSYHGVDMDAEGALPMRKNARQNSESSVSSSSSCCSDAVNIADQDKAFHGLPELIDKCWWIKSFFHSEPSPPTVGRKTLSASSANS